MLKKDNEVMNDPVKKLLKNISFSVLSSMISMIISALVVFLIPKQMTTEGYGYYQLYVLLIGYSGFFQFGLIDGIYIRYGGAYYESLDKKKMYSQFCVLWILQLVLFGIICLAAQLLSAGDRLFVIIFSGVEMILANTRGMLTYVLQSTNRIKEGAISNTIGRIVFFLSVVTILIFTDVNYKYIIVADVVGRLAALVYSSVVCKDIVFRKLPDFRFDFEETKKNLNVGFILMLSSIASLLIMGIVRLAMENTWGIETFAKISLTVSVSNLMVQFINAASLVFFPVLRRISKEMLSELYIKIKTFALPLLYYAMILYYPISKILLHWLPQYEEGLRYMAILFPICVYEGRMALINNTYLKTVSNVKVIFSVNIISVAISCLCTAISVYIIRSIPLAMCSLIIAIMVRCCIADFLICKKIQQSNLFVFIQELILMIVFIVSAWFIKSALSLLIYFIALVMYTVINYKKIIGSYKDIKKLLAK